MKDFSEPLPCPRNPYGAGIITLAVLTIVGVALIFASGVGSVGRPAIGLLLPGILLVTGAAIFLLGAVIAWRGFEKRFGRDLILGYWEVVGEEWQKHLKGEKSRLLKIAIVGGLGIPAVVVGVILVLAHSDGELDKVMPITLIVVLFQWFALTGNQGCVWLAGRGVLVNRTAFFVDNFGIETLSREVRLEGERHQLSIRYRVQVRHTTVDKELLVPVPEGQVELVEKTVAEWNRKW